MSGHARRRWVSAQALLVCIALLVAGCGFAGFGAGSGTGGFDSATAACPSTVVLGEVTPSVTLRDSGPSVTTNVPVGAVVEFRLAGQHHWNLGGVTPASALTPVGAQGTFQQGDCVWDMRVEQPGDITVVFSGIPICQTNQPCPAYALIDKFTLHGM